MNFGEVNVFYGVTTDSIAALNATLDPLVSNAQLGNIQSLVTELETYTWTAVPASMFGLGYEWGTFSDPLSIAIGERVVIAITSASTPDAITSNDDFGFAASTVVSLAGEGFTFGFAPSFGGASVAEVIVGQPGSITLVSLVPEPAHFAVLAGILGLGVVLWRRRR